MMGVLKSEQEADDSQKSFCNKDLASSANQKEDLEYKIGQTEALIERLEAKSSELEGRREGPREQAGEKSER